MQPKPSGKIINRDGSRPLIENKMAFTKLFKETVKARVESDPAFRAALLQEALSAIFDGDVALGKRLLKDLVN